MAIAISWIALRGQVVSEWGNDFEWFVEVAARWQATGDFYRVEQRADSYIASTGVSVLYPPIALYLFAPFTVLPAVLWWAIPIGIVGWHVVTSRPAWWAWPIMALLLFAPRSQAMIIWGNTGIWITALVALGLRFAWASPFVLLKPTFLLFAVIGIRQRAWWAGMGVFVLASLVMLPLWFDYLAAMRNNVGEWPPGLVYSPPTIYWSWSRSWRGGPGRSLARRLQRRQDPDQSIGCRIHRFVGRPCTFVRVLEGRRPCDGRARLVVASMRLRQHAPHARPRDWSRARVETA